jgi:hypothetical protein
MVVDDNGSNLPKTSFEVYLGDVHPKNLILSQTGDYGDGNNISRSFVLFKKAAGDSAPSIENGIGIDTAGLDATNGAILGANRRGQLALMCTVLLVALL